MSDEEKPTQTEAVDDSADREVDREIARKTRRSLLVGGVASLAGFGAWSWIRTRRQDDEIPWPMRVVLRGNEQIARDYFKQARLARTFAASEIEDLRQNGDIGLEDQVDANWKLQVTSGDGSDDPLSVTLDEIKALPKVEIITELKCIEGWSRINKWGGARFGDFVKKFAPDQTDPSGYVALRTPDGQYYVGLDMPSALHPQTLLCYEMNGATLTPDHGAPLRLYTPVKYGVKNLKRIGTITFAPARPADYWAERGYDWYAGL